MHLYKKRDYSVLTKEEEEIRAALDASAKTESTGKRNVYPQYPVAVRHHISLFPNNHFDLLQMKEPDYDMNKLNNEFYQLVHAADTKEQDILRFINKTPAYHIIGSMFSFVDYRFGHHEAYLFPEFQLGAAREGSMRPDYLLVGKGSGGYEFIFIEFEKSEGRIVLQNKYLGECYRKGINQVYDWKNWLPSYFGTDVVPQFEEAKNPTMELPVEFRICDPTRYHFVVVAGLRDDFNDKVYQTRRSIENDSGVILLHYDHLVESARALSESGRLTF